MGDRQQIQQSFLAARLRALATFLLILGMTTTFDAICRAENNPPPQLPSYSTAGFIAAIKGPAQVRANAIFFWDALDGWKLLTETERSTVRAALVRVAQSPLETPVVRARALDGLVKLDERATLWVAYKAFESRDPVLRRSALAAFGKWDARAVAFRDFVYIEPDERIRLLAAAAEFGATINLDAISDLIDYSQLKRIHPAVRQQILPLLPKIAKAFPYAERLDLLANLVPIGLIPVDQLADVLRDVPVEAATSWVRDELQNRSDYNRFHYALASVAILGLADLVEETHQQLMRIVADSDSRNAKFAARRYFRILTQIRTAEAKRLQTAFSEAPVWELNNLPPDQRSQELSRLLVSSSDLDRNKALEAISAQADRTDLVFLLQSNPSDRDGSELAGPIETLGPLATSADIPLLRALLYKALSPDVRVPIIKALARLKAVEASDDIAAVLSSSYRAEVQVAAILALGEIGGLKNTATLLSYLTSGTEPGLMAAAATTAGKLKVAEAVEPLINLLSQLPGEGPSQRISAALAQLDVGGQSTKIVETILQGCSCSVLSNVVAALPFALRSSEPESVVVRLLRMAQDRDAEIRPPIEAMAHLVGGGQPAPEAMIRWLGTGRRNESRLTDSYTAIVALREIEAAWPAVRKTQDVDFRRELARAIQDVSTSACTSGKEQPSSAVLGFVAKVVGASDSKQTASCWQGEDASLVRRLHAALLEAGDRNEASILEQQLDTAASEKWIVGILQLIFKVGGLWIILWVAMIVAYPWSRSIQSQVFWNDSLRKVAGFKLIDFLLRTIGPLRRLILRPFVRRLAEAARLDKNFAFFDGIRAASAQGHDKGRAVDALPRLQGCLELVGESGLGKTTLLRWLTRKAVSEGRVVAFLEARRCADGVYAELARMVEGIAKEDAFLRTLIHCRDLAVVIDGVNEVSPDTRARIVDFAISHADADVFLSTQPILSETQSSVPQLVLRPLSEGDLETFLLCFQDFLPPDATVTGENYAAAVKAFVNEMRSQPDQETRAHDLTILSNPIDLTLVSELLANGEKPQPSRLDQQIFEKAEQKWMVLNQGAPFPLEEFAEYCFTQRKNDSRRIDEPRFIDLAKVLARNRILIPRTESVKEGPKTVDRRYYVFRHERFADFFIFQAFTGPRGRNRRTTEIGDGRFRSVYLMVADRARREIAEETLGMLHDHALATKDLSVYADYYRRFAARSDVEAVVIGARAAA